MNTYVLDASSVLRFTDDGPGAARVEQLLQEAAGGNIRLLLSAVNWGEIVSVLYRRSGFPAGRKLAGHLKALPISIVAVDTEGADAAAAFKEEFKIPYADAFAGALTRRRSQGPEREWATLVTADFDFKAVPGDVMSVEFLATK